MIFSGENSEKKPAKISLVAVLLLTLCYVVLSGYGAKMPYSGISYLITILSAVCFASLYLYTHSPLLFLSLVGSYGMGLFFSHSPLSAVAALAYAPCGCVLALCILQKKQRTPTILRVALAVGAFYGVFFLLHFIKEYGSFSWELLQTYLADYFRSFQQIFESATIEVKGTMQPLYPPDLIQAVTQYIASLTPAILLCGFMGMAYLITALFYRVVSIAQCRFIFSDEKWEFTMSMVAASLFTALYVASLLSAGGSGTVLQQWNLLLQNLIFLLSPGFALLGLKRIRTRLKQKNTMGIAILSSILLITFLLINFPFVITLLSLFGVTEVFLERYSKRFKK